MIGGPLDRDRFVSALGVAFVHALLGYALLVGLAPGVIRQITDTPLSVFDVPPPAPPPAMIEPAPVARASEREEGRAAPPALRARPQPVVAPIPVVRQPAPPAPRVAADGAETRAGAAPVPGPGTGAGGVGDGLGSGRGGNGIGGGGGSSATLIEGRIADRDYPADARRAGASGAVTVRFTVQPNGRTTGCAVMASSGTPAIDATTCRLIEQRFRYRPARDASGKAIAEERGWRQRYWFDPPRGYPPILATTQ